MPPTLYQILEIESEATDDEIKKAYKKQALIWHPDKNSDGERFKEISRAYETLGNPKLRREYDRNLNGRGERMKLNTGFGFHDDFESSMFRSVFMRDPFSNPFGSSKAGAFSDPFFSDPFFHNPFGRDSLFPTDPFRHAFSSHDDSHEYSKSSRTFRVNGMTVKETVVKSRGNTTIEKIVMDPSGNILQHETTVNGRQIQ